MRATVGGARAPLFAGLVAVALVLTGLFAAQPSRAQDTEVDLELVLAVDISRSMDYDEQFIQRRGYADAFRHPEVLDAIRTGVLGRIAVMYVEWSGPMLQRVIVPWTLIDSPESAARFADALAETPLIRWQGTSISGSLLFSADQFAASAFAGMRQVIDVSGDGPNNMGQPVETARDRVLERGITINGLPIMLNREDAYAGFGIDNLDAYYQSCVIGGAGSFMITVRDSSELAEAIRRKMVLEIAAIPPNLRYPLPPNVSLFVPATEGAPMDCMIGEKLRRNFRP
jgi:hypothetical protein